MSDYRTITDYSNSDSSPTAGLPIAQVKPASQWAVDEVINSEEGTDDGRSEWHWIILNNGDVILGVFPHEGTYFGTETDREAG